MSRERVRACEPWGVSNAGGRCSRCGSKMGSCMRPLSPSSLLHFTPFDRVFDLLPLPLSQHAASRAVPCQANAASHHRDGAEMSGLSRTAGNSWEAPAPNTAGPPPPRQGSKTLLSFLHGGGGKPPALKACSGRAAKYFVQNCGARLQPPPPPPLAPPETVPQNVTPMRPPPPLAVAAPRGPSATSPYYLIFAYGSWPLMFS